MSTASQQVYIHPATFSIISTPGSLTLLACKYFLVLENNAPVTQPLLKVGLARASRNGLAHVWKGCSCAAVRMRHGLARNWKCWGGTAMSSLIWLARVAKHGSLIRLARSAETRKLDQARTQRGDAEA